MDFSLSFLRTCSRPSFVEKDALSQSKLGRLQPLAQDLENHTQACAGFFKTVHTKTSRSISLHNLAQQKAQRRDTLAATQAQKDTAKAQREQKKQDEAAELESKHVLCETMCACGVVPCEKLHSVASPSAMQLTMKQAKMILYLQRRHALELLAQPGVCGVNVKAHGVETQVFRSQKQPQYEEQRDGEAGNHFSTMTARPAARAANDGFALDDAGGDADKALTTLLYANEQWKAAEKAAAERKAAEEATEAGWAAAELLAKVEQAEKEKKTAKIKEKHAAENAAAKEGMVQAAKAKEQAAKVAKEARAQAVKVAKEAKAQAEKTAKETKESKAQAAEAKAQPPHTDSHEQKKPHVGVNVAGHKMQPKTEATGTKAKASTLSAPKPPKPDAPDTGQSAAFG
ncbi:hypothetical protein T492DRAFT_895219 [Pavlovales sp. CCMP2436]|nr:hypothetical protein T492DRAFT_895219 [Pavlovales sp. CCMP2436]